MSTQHQKLGLVLPLKKVEASKDDWCTPFPLFQWLSHYYTFTLDAAASKSNHLCPKYYTKEDNALKKSWVKGSKGGDIFCNHPYSQNEIFIKKMHKEAKRGATIVNLGPADTSCKYFEMYYEYCTTIYLINGRIKFKGAKNCATFASALYIFGKDKLADTYNVNEENIVVLKLKPGIRGGSR